MPVQNSSTEQQANQEVAEWRLKTLVKAQATKNRLFRKYEMQVDTDIDGLGIRGKVENKFILKKTTKSLPGEKMENENSLFVAGL